MPALCITQNWRHLHPANPGETWLPRERKRRMQVVHRYLWCLSGHLQPRQLLLGSSSQSLSFQARRNPIGGQGDTENVFGLLCRSPAWDRHTASSPERKQAHIMRYNPLQGYISTWPLWSAIPRDLWTCIYSWLQANMYLFSCLDHIPQDPGCLNLWEAERLLTDCWRPSICQLANTQHEHKNTTEKIE